MAKAERHRQSIPERRPGSSGDEMLVSAEIEGAARGDLVARRAYELYEERGRKDGHDWDDWFRAERETQHPQPASPAGGTGLGRIARANSRRWQATRTDRR